jgi:LemA protein
MGDNMSGLWIVLVGVAVAFALAIVYNSLVRKKNLAQEGWSGIDVQLKRRADLIPNLVETVKGYASHERTIFENVAQRRANAMQASSPDERSKAEGLLTRALGQLFAVAENYPDLKANRNFQQLQSSLAEIEEQIQLARRYYNATVRELNIGIQSFPSNLVASLFHFQPLPYFELEDATDKNLPKVNLT